MEKLDYIKAHVSEADLWQQLAEEAAELSQAASKMARMIRGTNPPLMTPKGAMSCVIEEHADVALCFELLEWNDKAIRNEVKKMKIESWCARIEGRAKDGN